MNNRQAYTTEARSFPLLTPDALPLTAPALPLTLAWRLRAWFAGKLPPRSYTSPDVRLVNPGWDSEEFNRQIEQLEFFLPTGHKIVLAGMEAYNLFIEATQAISGKGSARIEAFWLCGKLPALPLTPDASRLTELWRIGNGRVIRQRRPWGREWGGTATRGWKLGLVGAAPVSAIMRSE